MPEHALPASDVRTTALLRADAADRREDLDRLAHHCSAGAEPCGQLLLCRHPIARSQRELADQLQDLLSRQLIAGPVSSCSVLPSLPAGENASWLSYVAGTACTGLPLRTAWLKFIYLGHIYYC